MCTRRFEIEHDACVDMILKKASKRLHVHANVEWNANVEYLQKTDYFLHFSPSVLEYGCTSCGILLPSPLVREDRADRKKDVFQYPHLQYSEALTTIGCRTLAEDRKVSKYFKKAKTNRRDFIIAKVDGLLKLRHIYCVINIVRTRVFNQNYFYK